MTKHAPGPWEIINRGHLLDVWADGYGIIHTSAVPEVNFIATAQENANARLIAAAPELLEALLDVREQAYKVDRNGDVGLPLGAWERVLSVIAKAQGGQS